MHDPSNEPVVVQTDLAQGSVKMTVILQLQKQMQALCGGLQNEVQALRDD